VSFYCKKAELTQKVQEATSLGYRLEIHVIGDEAAENALNALEGAKVSPEKRPIFTHCQVNIHFALVNLKIS